MEKAPMALTITATTQEPFWVTIDIEQANLLYYTDCPAKLLTPTKTQTKTTYLLPCATGYVGRSKYVPP